MGRKQKRAKLKHRRAHQKRNKRGGISGTCSSGIFDRFYEALVGDAVAGMVIMPRRFGKNTMLKVITKSEMTARN